METAKQIWDWLVEQLQQIVGRLLRWVDEQLRSDRISPEQRRLKELTESNQQDELRELLNEHEFWLGDFFNVHEQGRVGLTVLYNYITPSINGRDVRFELDTLDVFVESSEIATEQIVRNVVSMMQSQLALDKMTADMFGPDQSLNGFVRRAFQAIDDHDRELDAHTREWLETAFAHGIPDPDRVNGPHQHILLAKIDHYAAVLDRLLEHVDDFYALLREHDLLGSPLDNAEWADEAMMPFGDLARFEDVLVGTALQTAYPTENLRAMVDTLVEQGYDLTDEQQRLYNETYGP